MLLLATLILNYQQDVLGAGLDNSDTHFTSTSEPRTLRITIENVGLAWAARGHICGAAAANRGAAVVVDAIREQAKQQLRPPRSGSATEADVIGNSS